MRVGFIFSLPRAGSTYTQRVLSAADGVSTTSEPWLMTALMGVRHGAAPVADFGFDHVRRGLSGMLESLDDPEAAWRRASRVMAEDLYANFTGPDELFLDKTPRNAVFSEEIIQSFPDGRFLFLWRNPLSVVHSINETWGAGRWKAYFYEYDLQLGLKAMIEAHRRFREDPRVMAVRYEDLVSQPDQHWPPVFAHFGLEYDPIYVAAPPKRDFRMGDESGQARFTGTSADSIESWHNGFGTAIRKHWARRYLNDLGADRLAAMGYSLPELLAQLADAPRRFRASDYVLITLSSMYHRLDPYVLREIWRTREGKRFARR